MKCPNCNETLLMTERHNVEIDYCPQCRGVWLDKGELDKLLEHASQRAEDSNYNKPAHNREQDTYAQDNYQRDAYSQEDYGRNDRYSDRNKHHPHGRKKKSFLSDFFDFD